MYFKSAEDELLQCNAVWALNLVMKYDAAHPQPADILAGLACAETVREVLSAHEVFSRERAERQRSRDAKIAQRIFGKFPGVFLVVVSKASPPRKRLSVCTHKASPIVYYLKRSHAGGKPCAYFVEPLK